jgi:transposase
MAKNPNSSGYNTIPTTLTEEQFIQFVLPHLSTGRRGPKPKLSLYKIFLYILLVLYTGMQWKSLPIKRNHDDIPEIHYTSIFRKFDQWSNDGSLHKVFESSVKLLHQNNLINPSVFHGDGTTTPAKKGGDNVGYSGYKHFKSEKIIAIVDRNVKVISPFITAPGNRHESPLFPDAFNHLTRIMNQLNIPTKGCVMSLDSAYDSKANRKIIFNRGMIPNIKENPRNRKQSKKGKKRIYSETIYEERFRTVERAFAWEDKFKLYYCALSLKALII